MPTWICPFCDAQMTVKPSLIGQQRPCAACGKQSEVIESLEQQPGVDSFPDVVNPPRPLRVTQSQAVKKAANIEDQNLTSVLLVQGVLSIVAIVSAIVAITGFTGRDRSASMQIQLGLTGLMTVLISWPIYTTANETYRNRKLLEEILKRQK